MIESGDFVEDNSQEIPKNTVVAPCKATSPVNPVAENSEKIDRELLLDISSGLIRALHDRLGMKRFRAGKHDSVKLAYARALTAAVVAHNAVLRDLEMEELERRIATLEGLKNER